MNMDYYLELIIFKINNIKFIKFHGYVSELFLQYLCLEKPAITSTSRPSEVQHCTANLVGTNIVA
jgi:hypothetical protein